MVFLYNDVAVKLRDIYTQIDDIIQSASLNPAQILVYLLHSTKPSNL